MNEELRVRSRDRAFEDAIAPLERYLEDSQ